MKVIDRNGAKTLIDIMKHLDSQVEGKIPSIEGLASEDWVLEKGYLDAEASKELHYTKKETDHKFFHKSDLSHLATKSWVHTHVYDKSEVDERFLTPSNLRDYWTKADVVIALEQLRSKLESEIKELANYEKIYELFFTKEQTLLEIDKVKDNLNDVINSNKIELHRELDEVKDELIDKINEKSDTSKLYTIFFTKSQTLLEIDHLRDTVEQWLHKYALKEDYYSKEHIDRILWELLVKGKVEGEIDIDFESLAKVAWVRDNFVKKEENSLVKDERGNLIPELFVDPDMTLVDESMLEEYVRKDENSIVRDEKGNLIKELVVDPDAEYVQSEDLADFATKEDLEEVKKSIPSSETFVTIETIDSKLEGYARLEDIPSDYLTSEDIKDFITEENLKPYATKSELEEVKQSIPSIEGLASEKWVESKGYLTEHQDISHLATKEEVKEVEDKIPSLDGFATEEWVVEQEYLTEHQDISNLATKEELKTVENKIPSLDGYATEEWVENKGYLVEDDLSPYAKKSELPSDYLTDKDLENYYDKGEIDKKITDAITEGKVDLSGYATEKWVEEQKYLKEHQDISNLATKEELDEVKESMPKDYLTEEDIEDFVKKESLESYVSKEDFEEYKEKVPNIEDIKSQLDEFATKQYVNDEINKLTKVECLTQEEYNNLGDAYDNNTFYIIYEEQ